MGRESIAGPAIGAVGLAGFAAAVVAVESGVLDQLVAAVAPTAGVVVLAAVVALVLRVVPRDGVLRIRIAPGHHVAEAITHEAHGHAAVAHGVGGKGIRARVYRDGSGWCDVRGPLTVAQELAITRAGEYVAGPRGCSSDRARARRELQQVPRAQRRGVSAEADALVRRHAGSAYGRRVARALERTGRYR